MSLPISLAVVAPVAQPSAVPQAPSLWASSSPLDQSQHGNAEGLRSDVRCVAAAASAVAVGAASSRARKSQRGSRRRRTLVHSTRLARSALAASVEVPEAARAELESSLLTEVWETALAGKDGDVWTEPDLFQELIGPVSESIDETIGTVSFSRISAAAGDDRDLVLYVPGIDFAGVFAAQQFRSFASEGLELWRCFVTPADRTPFAVLVRHLEKWIEGRLQAGRRVILFGESFGGLLSMALALRLGKSLKGLVLVNPATSFGRTPWALLGKTLAGVPAGEGESGSVAASDNMELLMQMNERAASSPYAYLGSMALAGAVADPSQLSRVASKIATAVIEDTVSSESTGPTDVLRGFLTYPEQIAKFLPPDTVRFRLRAWLRDGCEAVDSELRARSPAKTPLPPTLLVCSQGDNLLASRTEAKRLGGLIERRCDQQMLQLVELEDAGHAPLDGRVNLAQLLRDSPILKTPEKQAKRDYVGEYKYPTLEQLEEGSKSVEPIAQFLSPVFCSVDPSTEKRRFGIDGVPDPTVEGRPVILVGNHQLLALELGPLVREFLVKAGFTPRGLAHPINFPKENADILSVLGGDDDESTREAMGLQDALGLPFELRSALRASLEASRRFNSSPSKPAQQKKAGTASPGETNFGLGVDKWGGVPVNPRNFFRLLQDDECVLLFPGGAKEACHGAGDKYKLFWPSKTDFVRAAARFNAIIVPFGGVGSADNFRILERDGPEATALKAALGTVARSRGGSAPEGERSARMNRNSAFKDSSEQGGLMPVSESLVMPDFPPMVPRLPSAGQASPGVGDRLYFSFGRPVDTKDLDPKDRVACDKVYADIRQDVEKEIEFLLEARVRDPYRDFIRRQAFERVANFDKLPVEVPSGPLRGNLIRSYGVRAPSFEL